MDLNVAATIRITPKSVTADLDEIKGKLEDIVRDYGKVHKSEIKDIAFGIKSIEAVILLNDRKGGIDEIEEELRCMNNVSQVDVINISRF